MFARSVPLPVLRLACDNGRLLEIRHLARPTEPLSAAQMDSVLEVVGIVLYASACSAEAQAQIETSPAVCEAAELV